MDSEFDYSLFDLLDEQPLPTTPQDIFDWLNTEWDTEKPPAPSCPEPIQPRSNNQTGQNVCCETTETAPHVFQPSSVLAAEPNTWQPAQCGQPVTFSQGQSTNIPAPGLPPNLTSGLCLVRYLNTKTGEWFPPDASQTSVNTSKERFEHEQDEKPVTIKKPPNAFILYLKDQRLTLKAEADRYGSAYVNKLLAERWKSLTGQQKAKYKEQAKREAELHSQQHPEWSARTNYGKKKKRMNQASTHQIQGPEKEDPQPQGVVLQAPSFPGAVVEAPPLQEGLAEAPHLRWPLTEDTDLHSGGREESHRRWELSEKLDDHTTLMMDPDIFWQQ